MDRCGPVTGLVLCAVPGNKWFQKKKKKKAVPEMSMEKPDEKESRRSPDPTQMTQSLYACSAWPRQAGVTTPTEAPVH